MLSRLLAQKALIKKQAVKNIKSKLWFQCVISAFWDFTQRTLWLVADVSGLPIGPIFKAKAVQ